METAASKSSNLVTAANVVSSCFSLPKRRIEQLILNLLNRVCDMIPVLQNPFTNG